MPLPRKIAAARFSARGLFLALAVTIAASATPAHGASGQTPDYVFKYDRIFNFVDGIAAVERQGKTGYIDASGREIAPPKYDFGENFSDGFAVVTLNGKRGFINAEGHEVIPPQYDLAVSFSEGRAFAKIEGTWNIIDPTGKVIAPVYSGYEDVEPFEDGLARVSLSPIVGLLRTYSGYIDKDANVVIHAKYEQLNLVSDGVFAAKLDEKWGLLDRSGQTLAPFKYGDMGFRLADGRLKVRAGARWGYLDSQGKEAIPPRYGYAYDFKDGVARVRQSDSGSTRYGLIDTTGRDVIPPDFDTMADDFSDGLALVSKGDFHGFVDATGRTVVPLRYKTAQAFSEGLAAVSLVGGPAITERRWGYIDPTGKLIIEHRFDYAEPFKEGFAVVGTHSANIFARTQEGFTKGFVSKTGELTVPLSYANARPFSEGMAAVNVGQNTDTSQDQVSRDVTGVGTLSTGKWGFVDTTGRVVVEPQFADVKDFRNGYAVVNLGATLEPRPGGVGAPRVRGGKWGLIDRSGTLVLPIQYDSLSDVLDTGIIYLTAGGKSLNAHIVAIVEMNRGTAAVQAGQAAAARQHFLKAAEHGNATAVGNLGFMHAQGMGGTRNLAEARKWLTWGAQRGDPQSMMNLAGLLAQTQQRDDALAWFKRAEAAGHPQAKAAHDQLSRQPAPAASAPAARPAAPSLTPQPGNDWESLWADPATRFQKLAASYLAAPEADKARHIEFLATKITPLWMESNLANKYQPIRVFISANFELIKAMPEGEHPPARQLLYQAIHQAGLIAAKSGHSHPAVLYNWIQPKDAP